MSSNEEQETRRIYRLPVRAGMKLRLDLMEKIIRLRIWPRSIVPVCLLGMDRRGVKLDGVAYRRMGRRMSGVKSGNRRIENLS